MDINKAFPSPWIRACDLDDKKDLVLEIADCKMEEVGDDNKPVVYFAGIDAGLVLNKTNSNTIVDLYGAETTAWVGKKIALFPTQTEFGGKAVECIRVRIKAPAEELTDSPPF